MNLPSTPWFGRLLVTGFSLAQLAVAGAVDAGEIDPSQQAWYEQYKVQANAPDPATMRLNTDPEPDLTEGFVDLFNGRDLTGWIALGGPATFAVEGDEVVGRSVKAGDATYLCTDRRHVDRLRHDLRDVLGSGRQHGCDVPGADPAACRRSRERRRRSDGGRRRGDVRSPRKVSTSTARRSNWKASASRGAAGLARRTVRVVAAIFIRCGSKNTPRPAPR